jgi:hypothetical protein
MKKNILFLSTGIILLSIVASSAAQAPQLRMHRQNSISDNSREPAGVLTAMAGSAVGNRVEHQRSNGSGKITKNMKRHMGDAEYYEE